MVRAKQFHKVHDNLIPGIIFVDRCKAVARLAGKHFNEDKHRFYTYIRVAVARCGISYCDKHEKNKDRRASWKELSGYYYGSINNENKVKTIKKKIRRASYFKEETGFNY